MSCHRGVCLVGMLVVLFPHHCKGYTCSWEVFENTFPRNPHEQLDGIMSLDACQERCDERSDCVAVAHTATICYTYISIPARAASYGWTHALKVCTNETTSTSPTARTSSQTTPTTETTSRTTTTTTIPTPPAPPSSIPPSGQTSTKSTLISIVSTMTQSTEDSPANEATGVSVAVIAGVVGAAVALVIAGIIVVFVVVRNKRNKPLHPGHLAASITENRGHRMASVTDNGNTTDGVTPAAEHRRTGDRYRASTTENVYEITENSGHYYEPLSHRENTYINDNTMYSNYEGGGRSEVNSVSGGNTTYYNTGVQTNVNCNDNTTYHNMY